MKRLSLFFLLTLLAAAIAEGRPAHQRPARVQQPDGSMLTIRLVGDEYLSFSTTDDGYTLTRDERGYYVYAQLDADGRLVPSGRVARDAAERTPADIAFLGGLQRCLAPRMSDSQAATVSRNKVARQQALQQRRASRYDYSKFRGLVILVEYKDCPFLYSDYGDIMEKMINQDNYTGETRTNIGTIRCTGSIRDYFRDNSSGSFTPTFDVVGPVKINRSQYYPRPYGGDGPDNYAQLISDAVIAADSQVDFKDYDVDGDGSVDMVYFIFSGLGSYVSGNDERLLWPHQSDLRYSRQVRKDGVLIGRYACSTELFGSTDYYVLEGIGTMTHEFSHVLGLPDFYDTNNYDPEECVAPGLWSVMANGADGNYGRTPINFSLFERYALGFATPEVISQPGQFAIEAIHKSNQGYRLNTPVNREYFLLENRQKEKWDAVLPGHGMLIFRVDSTNAYVWTANTVNDNPKHPYYELVRARGEQTLASRDPFPGTARVTAIDNDTEPANLRTWSGRANDLGLRDITERNGIISFEAFYANVLTAIQLPESIVLGHGTSMQLTPVLTPENASAVLAWKSDNEGVATVEANGMVTARAVGTAVITVTANNVLNAQCKVIVKEQEVRADIADFCSMEAGDAARLTLNDAQVLFAASDGTFARDRTGAIKLGVEGLQAQAGDRLGGTLFGMLEFSNMMPQLAAVDGSTSVTTVAVSHTDTAPVPTDVSHNGSLTYTMLCDLVTLRGVTLTLENKMVFAQVGSQRARVYNTFGLKNIAMPKTSALAGKYFDVTGILTTDIIGGELAYVISITQSVVEVERPDDGMRGDVNADGTVDVADISTIITVMAGHTTSAATVGDGKAIATRADVNGDGTVDVADISTVIAIMAE